MLGRLTNRLIRLIMLFTPYVFLFFLSYTQVQIQQTPHHSQSVLFELLCSIELSPLCKYGVSMVSVQMVFAHDFSTNSVYTRTIGLVQNFLGIIRLKHNGIFWLTYIISFLILTQFVYKISLGYKIREIIVLFH